jgi:glycosyltransferase involved in cell wall biosynthesis
MTSPELRVTLIMPTYRRPHTIQRAIDTIRAQSYPHWDLIVSNNGPEAYSLDDPRIRVLNSSAVRGAAYARNQAIAHASGDLIGFFDDDDEMYPDYLETIVDVFRRLPAVQMVHCFMIYRGLLNTTYGTPTAIARRHHITPTWEPTWRQDRFYYEGIIRRNGFSEEAGSLYVIPRPLCKGNNDPEGGLRAGQL